MKSLKKTENSDKKLPSRPHYVDWVLNGKNTSHFQFLQKPFILDKCKPLKKKFYVGHIRYFHFSVFEIAWTSWINLKKNGDIILNIQAFELLWVILVFQPKRSQNWHLSSFARKIATVYFVAIFLAKENKCHFWDLFGEKTRITH